ncbi:NADAR family protein [Pseudomonas typographi]|uniref:NADAR family protein n=1 Tax=Pseudomonas typographi TaxID=2715964 RepID=A0ABR7Z1B7_9PSED|nr:NADAR family protein [Pseudomonas typographi]MBD1554813.1 NADAR family protein [Pseudomonas typographi]MBD1587336.1 NADAR family protein [Pseudomonas typographi]MBD1599168.1 NADAR family protein [Pseudomonas typographi]
MNEIRFYDPRHGEFCALSNLHPRALEYAGQRYATAEHAYQVLKARPALREWLMAAPTAELVAAAGDALAPEQTVDHWYEDHVKIMTGIVRAKFDQHPDLRALLLGTQNARLVEWAPDDSEVARYWGEYQGQGHNVLGKILMGLRHEYRQGRFGA